MIRFTKHMNVNYIVVDGTVEIDGIILPTQVQVNIDKIREEDRSKVFRILSTAFNRNISFDKPKPQSKKSWWRVW
jgi:predicted transcriptional regulator